jgi:hypothetical protein
MKNNLRAQCSVAILLFMSWSALQSLAQTELIQNGGFESGGAGWTMGGGAIADSTAGYARSGSSYAWLGGVADEVDFCYQQITIPAGVINATLSFWYNILSNDDPSGAYDTFNASIRDSSNNVLANVLDRSNQDSDSGNGPAYYHQQTFDLLPYAGQTIRVYFSSENDSTYPTSFDIDDVSVQVTPSGGNRPPVAQPQNLFVNENSTLPITLTATDPDSDPLTYSIVTPPSNGSLSGTPANVTYQPNANFSGPDSFTFKANDGHVDSAPATVSITVTAPLAGLIIIPTWDSTITSDPNAADIENTINAAIQVYEGKFSDPVTVNIKFAEMNTGLGQSTTFFSTLQYSTFYNALVADAKTTNDTIGLAHIPGGSINPVDGTSSIRVTTANQRALGLSANNPLDSTISLNMSIINITRTSIDPNKYDLMAVASHEIDEALGSASGLGGPNITPADLFRYNSAGTRSYITTGDDAWFSIDGGATRLVQYNQNGNGDYGDWWSFGGPHTPRVQDAFATAGATPNLGVELTLLDVIGWDLVIPIPPPTIQSVTRSNSALSISWTSVLGKSYQPQYKTNIAQSVWVNLGSPIVASGPTASTTDSIGPDPSRFYRIVLLSSSSAAPLSDSEQQFVATRPLSLETRYFLPEQAAAMKSQPVTPRSSRLLKAPTNSGD